MRDVLRFFFHVQLLLSSPSLAISLSLPAGNEASISQGKHVLMVPAEICCVWVAYDTIISTLLRAAFPSYVVGC